MRPLEEILEDDMILTDPPYRRSTAVLNGAPYGYRPEADRHNRSASHGYQPEADRHVMEACNAMHERVECA